MFTDVDPPAIYHHPEVCRLRADLALCLRAADKYELSEGIDNHFSVMLPGGSDHFLINPRGLHWSEVGCDDIVLVDDKGTKLAGSHDVEPTAMFIHAAVHRIARHACVLHTHMPFTTAITLTSAAMLDTTLSQNAMRFHGRVTADRIYNGVALDAAEGERIARGARGFDILFLANHGAIVCGERLDYAFEDLYFLERACQVQMIAAGSKFDLVPAKEHVAAHTAKQIEGERLQATLFFEALRRLLPEPRAKAGAAT